MSATTANAPLSFDHEPIATTIGLLFLVMTVPTLASLALDDRTLGGVSVWLKPLKFQLSFAVHVLTVAFALRALDPRVREGATVRTALFVVLATAVFEVVWITLQGARGLPSHFATTRFGLIMYILMGVAGTLVVLATSVLGVLTLRHPAPGVPRILGTAVGLGLLIAGLTGLVTGWAISMNNGPLVGGLGHGGPAIPILGWSGTGGDLRVSHFVGLHAAQLLPMLGLALVFRPLRGGYPLLIGSAVLWSGLTLTLFAQAMAGRPFIPLG